MTSDVNKQLKKVEQDINQGEFKKALKSIEKTLKIDDIKLQEKLACFVLKSEILTKMGDYQEVFSIADTVIKESQNQDLVLPRLDVLIQQSEAYFRTGNFEKHLVLYI